MHIKIHFVTRSKHSLRYKSQSFNSAQRSNAACFEIHLHAIYEHIIEFLSAFAKLREAIISSIMSGFS